MLAMLICRILERIQASLVAASSHDGVVYCSTSGVYMIRNNTNIKVFIQTTHMGTYYVVYLGAGTYGIHIYNMLGTFLVIQLASLVSTA